MKTMIKSLCVLALTFQSAYAIDCSAERREVTNKGVNSKSVKLEKVLELGSIQKLATDIDEAYFSVNIDGTNVTSMITMAPTYTTGNLSKGSMGTDGKLKLSFVTPGKTYILTCDE